MAKLNLLTDQAIETLRRDHRRLAQLPFNDPDLRPQHQHDADTTPHNIFVDNEEDEAIPAYAVMLHTGIRMYQNRVLHKAEKPSGEVGEYFWNTGREVPAGAKGWRIDLGDYNEIRLIYEESLSPSPGDIYGPIEDEWYCGPDTALPIFVVLGVVDSSRHILLARMTDNISGIGKANETISNRESGEISIWNGTFGSESDSGVSMDMFNLGPEVVEDDWVSYEIKNGQLVFGKLCGE